MTDADIEVVIRRWNAGDNANDIARDLDHLHRRAEQQRQVPPASRVVNGTVQQGLRRVSPQDAQTWA